jgi:hypothetical protein
MILDMLSSWVQNNLICLEPVITYDPGYVEHLDTHLPDIPVPEIFYHSGYAEHLDTN